MAEGPYFAGEIFSMVDVVVAPLFRYFEVIDVEFRKAGSRARGGNMEIRHLRCFMAVAEELHFGRAAEKLHIEQSPLSRAIKELEEDLGTRLFDRTTRSTRLTRAGRIFLEQMPRIFTSLNQAVDSVKAVTAGYHGQLRVALSDGVAQSQLVALLAQCREEDPEVEIRLFEMPLAQQIKGLREDLYDVGLARSAAVGEGIIAEPVWCDQLVIAVPARHPLLVHKSIPLNDLLRYPLVICHPKVCEGCSKQIATLLRPANTEPIVAEEVTTNELMLALVAAGFGLGFTTEAQLNALRHPDVVPRRLAGKSSVITTYMLHSDSPPTGQLARFLERTRQSAGDTSASSSSEVIQ